MEKIDLANFKPHHINGERNDFIGNENIGRYVFIPGSSSRADHIAKNYLQNVKIKKSSRGHDLYLGDLIVNGSSIQVAAVSTGMGSPSVDLILSELIFLGAKRFLRIGTAGGMQPHVEVGDVVLATAAIRDESTSNNYVPESFPATSNVDMIVTANTLVSQLPYKLHLGVVHSKDSLYARECLCGPSARENLDFMEKVKSYGTLATEMECAHTYVLSRVYSQQLGDEIKAGCLLGIIGNDNFVIDEEKSEQAIENSIDCGLKLISNLAIKELG